MASHCLRPLSPLTGPQPESLLQKPGSFCTSSPLARLRMRAVSLLVLAPGIIALPQDLGSLLGGFLGNRGGGRSLQDTVRNIINNPVIQERILNNDLNPCPVRYKIVKVHVILKSTTMQSAQSIGVHRANFPATVSAPMATHSSLPTSLT